MLFAGIVGEPTNVSYKILAEVEFTRESEGVIVAQGSRFGGYTLFVKDGKLTYVYNFLGIPPEQTLTVDAPSPGSHIVGVESTKERGRASRAHRQSLKLHIDDEDVGDGDRTMAPYSLCGEGLCVGYDGGERRQPAIPAEVLRSPWSSRQSRVRRGRRRLHRRRATPRCCHGAGLDRRRAGSGATRIDGHRRTIGASAAVAGPQPVVPATVAVGGDGADTAVARLAQVHGVGRSSGALRRLLDLDVLGHEAACRGPCGGPRPRRDPRRSTAVG